MKLTKLNYVDKAEEVVKRLERDRKNNYILTTSKQG